MKKTSKKLLAVLMSVVMVIGLMVPITVVADYELDLYQSSEVAAEYEPSVIEDEEDELANEEQEVEEPSLENEEPSLEEVAAPPSIDLNDLFSVSPLSTDQLELRIVPRSPSIAAGGDTLVDIHIVRLPAATNNVWDNFALDIVYDSNVIEPIPVGANPNFFAVADPDTWLAPNGFSVGNVPIPHQINPPNAVSPGNTIRVSTTVDGGIASDAVFTMRFRSVGPQVSAPGTAITWGIFADGSTAGGFGGFNYVLGAGAGTFRLPVQPGGEGRITVGPLSLRVTVTGNGLMPADINVVSATHSGLVWTQAGNVFTAPVLEPISGTVTASAIRFEPRTVDIPLFVNGFADMAINLELTQIPPDTGALEGVITNAATGAPIAGATVTVVVGNQVFEGPTDSLGMYRIVGLPVGDVLVLASADNFYAGFAPNNPVAILENQTSIASFGLQPRTGPGPGYHLTVNVTGPAANELASIDRAGFAKDPNSNVFTITTATPLTGTITASAPGFESNVGTIPAYVNNRAVLTIHLTGRPIPPGRGAIQGRVTNNANGNSLAGATVILLNMAGTELSRVTSGPAGDYYFNNLDIAMHRIIVSHPEFYPQSRDVQTIADIWVIADFQLVPRFGGTPTDATLIVNLVNIGNAEAWVSLAGEAIPQRDGIWSITSMFPPIGRLDASALGFLPATRNMVNADFQNPARLAIVNFTLEPDDEPVLPSVLRGFVRVEGTNAPIADAIVLLFDENGNRVVTNPLEIRTNASGFYSVSGLLPGTYTVTAQHPDHGVRAANEKAVITMTEGAHVNVYLRYQPVLDGFLVLVNVEPSSAVAAGPTVTVGGLAMTHLDGNTWRHNVTMPAAFNVLVTAPLHLNGTASIAPASFVNQIANVTVRLQRQTEEGVLQGYVFEANTNPQSRVPFASVSVVNNATGASEVIQANYDGFFRFEGLALGSYTLAAWADGFRLAQSPTPVVLALGSGVHRNIEIERDPITQPAFNLMITVLGPDPDATIISLPGVSLQRVAGTNVWQARGNAMMLGALEVDAPRFRPQTRNIVATDYVNGDAFIVINLEEIDAIIRLFPHYPGGNPAFYYEIEMPDIDIVIPANLRPNLRTMYGTPGNPGWAFLGWYEDVVAQMHYINRPGRITTAQREAGIDRLANLVITELMLDVNGVFELHGTWVRFGDLNGDGVIDPVDRSLMQNRILGALDNDGVIMQTANVNPDTDNVVDPVDRSLLQNHILGAPGVILGFIQQ